MTGKGKKAGLGLGLFGGSAAFALVTLGGSMATIVVLLDRVMPLWQPRGSRPWSTAWWRLC